MNLHDLNIGILYVALMVFVAIIGSQDPALFLHAIKCATGFVVGLVVVCGGVSWLAMAWSRSLDRRNGRLR